MNLTLKLSAEMLAIMMIGDGMLALTQPRRHMRLWNAGPEPWRRLVSYFETRPAQTMAVGAASVGLGLWLASCLDRGEARVEQALSEEPDQSDAVLQRTAYAEAIGESAHTLPGI